MLAQTTQPTPTNNPIMARMARALKEADRYQFVKKGAGYRVLGGSAEYTLRDGVCSCPDHQRRGGPCKHQLLLVSGYAAVTTEEDHLREIQRERVKEARRVMELDFPSDDYDRKPSASDPFGPLPDPTPEARWWEDQMRAAEYGEWLAEQMDSGLNYPAD